LDRKKYVRKCLFCGNEFETLIPQQRICQECIRKYYGESFKLYGSKKSHRDHVDVIAVDKENEFIGPTP